LFVSRHFADGLIRDEDVKVLLQFHNELDYVKFIGAKVTE